MLTETTCKCGEKVMIDGAFLVANCNVMCSECFDNSRPKSNEPAPINITPIVVTFYCDWYNVEIDTKTGEQHWEWTH